MNFLLALILSTAPSYAAVSINNYSCVGEKLDERGNVSGYGSTLVVLLDNGTARLLDKDRNRVIELHLEGADRSGSAQIYRTESTDAGLGLAISEANIGQRLGVQVYLYLFSISKGRAEDNFRLDCRVSSSSRL